MTKAISQISIELDEDELQEWMNGFVKTLKIGDVLGLCGDMGAGKTTFTRCLLQALDYDFSNGFSSPTFAIINSYDTSIGTMKHFDLYRLNDVEEFYQMDLMETMTAKDSISVIEWADKFTDIECCLTLKVLIQNVPERPEHRQITLYAVKSRL